MGRWCFLIGFKSQIPLIALNKLVDRLRQNLSLVISCSSKIEELSRSD